MTLVAARVRKNRTLRELVIASDSRISGGESWDACPKIVPLPRPATVIAMSGDAVGAYSFLLQAINTCNLLDGHVVGRTDIGYLANKLRDVFADSRSHVGDLPMGSRSPSVLAINVVMVGWSWRNLRFEGYSYRFASEGRLIMTRLGELGEQRAYPAYLFGDASTEARRRVKALIRARGLPIPMRGNSDAEYIASSASLDWEPLEVLLDIIEDPTARTVGGVRRLRGSISMERRRASCGARQMEQIISEVAWFNPTNDLIGESSSSLTERFECRIRIGL